MEARELRIGNYVYHKNYPGESYLVQHIICNTAGDINYHISHGTFNKDLFEPIPVTPEWLEMFGFVCEIKGVHQYWKRANKSGEYLDWLSFRTSEMSSWGLIGREMKDHFQSYLQDEVKIFFVHQLQNLYFALTGEELILKEVVG